MNGLSAELAPELSKPENLHLLLISGFKVSLARGARAFPQRGRALKRL